MLAGDDGEPCAGDDGEPCAVEALNDGFRAGGGEGEGVFDGAGQVQAARATDAPNVRQAMKGTQARRMGRG